MDTKSRSESLVKLKGPALVQKQRGTSSEWRSISSEYWYSLQSEYWEYMSKLLIEKAND